MREKYNMLMNTYKRSHENVISFLDINGILTLAPYYRVKVNENNDSVSIHYFILSENVSDVNI